MEDTGKNKQLPRLPACQSCYTKKAKCDSARPKCTACVKSGHACLTVSLDGSEPVSREYIYELERRVQNLQQEIPNTASSLHSSSNSQTPVNAEDPVSRHDEPSQDYTVEGDPPRDDVNRSPNFTEGAGISFMSLLFTDARWREQNQKLLHNLSKSSTILETAVKPNQLPPSNEALDIFNIYLGTSHVQNPFLLRRYVQGLYQSVFSSGVEDQSQPPTSAQISSHDLFRTFMILAIGAVPLYRGGKHKQHPYGYFLAAMQHTDSQLLCRGLDSIQDLLLVGRFGIYHHIGTSIWEIMQLCTRMCIEQSLHRRRPPSAQRTLTLLDEQLQRRVFWQCYMIDRYSSVTLDRPPAIADKDIQIGFPADVDDEELDMAEASGSFADLDSYCRVAIVPHDPVRTTEMSVSHHVCLPLRRITSKIHTKFQQKVNACGDYPDSETDTFMVSGQVYADLDELLVELQYWRNSTPFFQNPKCLYERQEWYDLLLMRERLLLVRKAIDLIPKRNNVPPRDLLCLCLQYAVGAIMTFYPLFNEKKITYTRSYFHTMFTAGLSIMFCLSVVVDLSPEEIANAIEGIQNGEAVLKEMIPALPDAVHYVAVYEALRVDILGKLKSLQGGTSTSLNSAIDPSSLGIQRGGYDSLDQHGQLYPLSAATVQAPAQWAFPTSDLSAAEPPLLNNQEATMENSLLSWDIFGDSIFWSMEAGLLGEYACGDPSATSFFDDGL